MKKMFLILGSIVSVTFIVTYACTTIIVGSKVSATGKAMIIRNEDVSTNNWPKFMQYRPAHTFKNGAVIKYTNGLTVSAPSKLYAYSAMPDWNAKSTIKDGHAYDERGINSKNVAMTGTNSFDFNKKAKMADPLVKKGSIIEENMTSLILPRISTAREGVKLLGKYIEKYGTGETNGIIFADAKEIWYMETVSGHHWVAIRIPSDQYFTVANGMRLSDVNLDSSSVMHSKGIFDLVKNKHLLSNPSRKHFNSAKAFGKIGVAYNTDRVWFVQHALTPSLNQAIRKKAYPILLKPDSKITFKKLQQIESHPNYRGTPLQGKSKRPIAVNRNSETHAFIIDKTAPKPLQIVLYQSLATIKYGLFVPYFNVSYKIPKVYNRGTAVYSSNSAWWTFRLTDAMGEIPAFHQWVVKDIAKRQAIYMKRFSVTKRRIAKVYKSNPKRALRMMSSANRKMALKAYRDAKKYNNRLLTLQTIVTNEHYTKKIGRVLLTTGKAPQ